MSRKKNENDGESRQKLYCQEKREHKWFLQSISSENQSYNRIHFNCVYDIELFHMVKVDISAEFIFLMQRYYITYFQPKLLQKSRAVEDFYETYFGLFMGILYRLRNTFNCVSTRNTSSCDLCITTLLPTKPTPIGLFHLHIDGT